MNSIKVFGQLAPVRCVVVLLESPGQPPVRIELDEPSADKLASALHTALGDLATRGDLANVVCAGNA